MRAPSSLNSTAAGPTLASGGVDVGRRWRRASAAAAGRARGGSRPERRRPPSAPSRDSAEVAVQHERAAHGRRGDLRGPRDRLGHHALPARPGADRRTAGARAAGLGLRRAREQVADEPPSLGLRPGARARADAREQIVDLGDRERRLGRAGRARRGARPSRRRSVAGAARRTTTPPRRGPRRRPSAAGRRRAARSCRAGPTSRRWRRTPRRGRAASPEYYGSSDVRARSARGRPNGPCVHPGPICATLNGSPASAVRTCAAASQCVMAHSCRPASSPTVA